MEDTAWHPIPKEQAEKWNPAARFLFRTFLGSPLKLWASVGHWAIWHFDLSLYTEKQKPRVSHLRNTADCLPFSWLVGQQTCMFAFLFADPADCTTALVTWAQSSALSPKRPIAPEILSSW